MNDADKPEEIVPIKREFGKNPVKERITRQIAPL
jgi:hypothetical protein